jgi:hypothetical protein
MDGQVQNPLRSGGEAITLDGARGALTGRVPERKPEPAAEQAPPQPEQQPPAPEQDDASDDNARVPEEDRGEPNSQEATNDDAGDDAPRHEPPAHWKKSVRDYFKTLPPHVQAELVAQERERDRLIDGKLRDAAEKGKTLESERTTIDTERQRIKAALDQLLPDLQLTLQGKWAGVNWDELAAGDQATYVAKQHEFRKDMARLQLARAERDRIAQQEAAAAQKARDEAGMAEWNALTDKRPELKDKAKAKAFFDSITAYAQETGFPVERFNQSVSHLELLTLEKPMLYDKAQKAKADAVVKPVPKVQQPGTAQSKVDRAAEDRAAKLKTLQRTGKLEHARGLLRI